MNSRRKLIIALGAGALYPLFMRHAQSQTKVWRVGFLSATSAAAASKAVEALRAGLREAGYVEGNNLALEFRWADGKFDRLPALAAELVQLKVDAIIASSSLAVEAMRQATASIPIVMTGVGNPVGSGFVASLAHPGGNITGLTNVSIDISSKYLEFLHEAAPKVSRVAILINPVHANHPVVLKQVQAGAKSIGVTVAPITVRTVDQMGAALAAVVREHAGALIVPPDPGFQTKAREVAEFAVKHRLPTMFGTNGAAESGGLLSYAANTADMMRRAGGLIAKILGGTKPADLPVEFPTRFEMAVNLKVAKALGLTIPQSLLIRADKIIQ